jgi:hypothetical protein
MKHKPMASRIWADVLLGEAETQKNGVCMKAVPRTVLIEQNIEACVHVKSMSARTGKLSPMSQAMEAN